VPVETESPLTFPPLAHPSVGLFFCEQPERDSTMARPTKYDPSFCDKVIEWGKLGKSIAWIAAELEVSKECVYNWARENQQFSDALAIARLKSQQYWEDEGQDGMKTPGFNASIWSRSMAARFPDDWREKSETALTNANGGPVDVAMTLEVIGVPAQKG
jgi:hypothetical protein